MQKITLLQRLSIYADIIRQRNLCDRRNVFYQKSLAAKIVVGLLSVFTICYLLAFAIMMAITEMNSAHPSYLGMMMGFMLFFLDLIMRFFIQQTPSQIVKPYLLLPVPLNAVVESFIFSSLLRWANLIWMAFALPYSAMVVFPVEGFARGVLFLLSFHLLFLISSQLYMLIRTRLLDSILWLIPVIAVPAIALGLAWWHEGSWMGALEIVLFEMPVSFMRKPLLAWSVALAVLVVLLWVNRIEQRSHVLSEVRASSVTTTTVSERNRLGFLQRWGALGEYMIFELRLIWRNRNPRKGVITRIAMAVSYSALFGFMDSTYSDMTCYIFMLFGLVFLPMEMFENPLKYELNFESFMRIHARQYYHMLYAKYVICVILFLAELAVIMGILAFSNLKLVVILALALFCIGPFSFIIMSTIRFNNEKQPLNEKLTGVQVFNYMTIIISMIAIAIPVTLLKVLSIFWSLTTVSLIISLISLPFIILHRPIIRRISSQFGR